MLFLRLVRPLLAAALGLLAGPEPGASTWLAEAPPARPTRVAVAGDRVFMGTERGLYRAEATGLVLVLAHEAIRDLAAAEGGLWVATERALYFIHAQAETDPLRAGLGAGAQPTAVAIDGRGRVWAATDAGLFLRDEPGVDFRRAGGLPPGPVESVRALGPAVFAATRGVVWQESEPGRFAPRLRSVDEGWWELCAVEQEGDAFLLAVPQGVWHLASGETSRIELGIGELRDLLDAGGRHYLASARGVFAVPIGELDRAAPRLLIEREALDLAAVGPALLTVTPRGIARLAAPESVDAVPGHPFPADPERAFHALVAGEPEIERVQRSVLAYLELAPSRMRALEERARRSALWPELRLGFGYDLGHQSERQRDAVFTGGTMRDLFDTSRQRDTAFDLGLQLEWQLAGLASPDQAIAVSKERRELIELRDQVLERVNRLYFERRRVLARIAALEPQAAPERRDLEIRAQELAAQLDAWTGGAFARLRQGSPSPTGRRQ